MDNIYAYAYIFSSMENIKGKWSGYARLVKPTRVKHHKILCNFVNFHTANTRPSSKDLYQYFTPQYAVQWRVIGTLLGLPMQILDFIEHDNHYKAKECCNAMLNKWLQVDITASWGRLFTVIESPAVSWSAPDKGD